MSSSLTKILRVDWQLVIPALFITVLSTFTLWGFLQNGIRLVSFNLIIKHIISVILGIICMFIVARFDYRTIKSSTRSLYGLAIIVLVLVLVIGQEVNGSRSWFRFGPISFQPVEMAKLILILSLAKYISLYHRLLYEYRFVMLSAIPVFLVIFLIILQPDLGSAMIVCSTWFVMIVIGGMRKRYVLLMIASFVTLSFLAWNFYLADYQKDRLRVFIDPNLDPQGSGYNTLQALEAIRSGGWTGFKASGPRDLVYVPEVHTDFIFAGYAQEWGFVGVSVYFLLLSFIMLKIYQYIETAPDIFTRMVLSGMLILLSVQSCINIGMNIGMMPVTGIPLPFMSYGGSSMVFSWIMLGIVQSMHQAKGTKFSNSIAHDIM